MNEKDDKTKSTRKKRLKSALIATAKLGVSALSIFGGMELYDSFFKRYDKPDYSLVAGEYCFERVSHKLSREKISFLSNSVRLQGYYYEVKGSKGLIVLSHGMHAGADDYLPMTLFFVKNGYSVFSYDYKGTHESDGESTVGMCESLVDLDHALAFLESDKRFSNKKLFLVGHSWGAYATASVLSLHRVSACACIAGFNSGYTLILEKGYQYAGELADKGVPKVFLEQYQKKLFGKYINFSAVKGINSGNTPVLIAHGVDDKVIGYNHQSIHARRSEITNPNVTYYIGEGLNGGHDSIWHSAESVEYQNWFKQLLKTEKKEKGRDLTDDEKRNLYKKVNHELYSEINKELFSEIINLFNKQL